MLRQECDAIRELLVGDVYDEIEPPDRARLAAHLERCPDCREEVESLRGTRRALRAAFAAVPSAPPSTLVLMPRRPALASRPLWLAAAAALVGLAALALARAEISFGPQGTSVSLRLSGPAPVDSPAQAALPGEVVAALARLEARGAEERQRLLRAVSEELDRRDAADRGERQASLARLVDELDRRRAQDLGYLLSRMGTLEERTGEEVARTQQILQYAMATGAERAR